MFGIQAYFFIKEESQRVKTIHRDSTYNKLPFEVPKNDISYGMLPVFDSEKNAEINKKDQ